MNIKPQSAAELVRQFISSHKLLTSSLLVILIINNFLNVLLPLSIGLFYEVVLGSKSTKGYLLHWLPFKIHTPTDFFAFLGVLIVLKTIFTYFEKYWSGILSEAFAGDVRKKIFSTQMRQTLSAFRSRPIGKHLMRYSGDLTALQNFVHKGVLVFIGDFIFIILALWILASMQPILTLFVLGILLISIVVINILSKLVLKKNKARKNQRSNNMDFVSTRLQAFYTIKSFNRETREINHFIHNDEKLQKRNEKYQRIIALVQAMYPFFFFVMLGVVLYVIYQFRLQHIKIHHSVILSYVLLLLYMRSVIRRLLEVNVVWQSGLTSLKKVIIFLQSPQEEKSIGTEDEDLVELATTNAAPNAVITINGLNFAYDKNETPLIENLDAVIPSSGITLIKGKGKSTFFKILQKIYIPDSGKILINNIDYQTATTFELRKQISIVSAEAPLLGDTIFEAIVFRPKAEKRAKALNILRKLDIMPNLNDEELLDFPLEESAHNLAAGEIVLLQLARAFLTNKKILLLDEPFRNLDSESMNKVAEILIQYQSKRSILLVSESIPDILPIEKTIVIGI